MSDNSNNNPETSSVYDPTSSKWKIGATAWKSFTYFAILVFATIFIITIILLSTTDEPPDKNIVYTLLVCNILLTLYFGFAVKYYLWDDFIELNNKAIKRKKEIIARMQGLGTNN